jgi:hypothetical protein
MKEGFVLVDDGNNRQHTASGQERLHDAMVGHCPAVCSVWLTQNPFVIIFFWGDYKSDINRDKSALFQRRGRVVANAFAKTMSDLWNSQSAAQW